MIYIALLLWIVNEKWVWIGICLGIPLACALFMGDDDSDALIRRSTDRSDEGEK